MKDLDRRSNQRYRKTFVELGEKFQDAILADLSGAPKPTTCDADRYRCLAYLPAQPRPTAARQMTMCLSLALSPFTPDKECMATQRTAVTATESVGK